MTNLKTNIEEVAHAIAKPDDVEREAPGGLVEIEKSRAIQEVQAMFVMARKFPRDEIAAETAIMKTCERFSFAEKARFKYPRGGKEVVGLSIRAAETIASAWGNLRYGWREVNRSRGKSDVEATCWDLESNVQSFRQFQVEHSMKSGNQIKFLTDPRDIYEHIANMAQRRQRACILERIPYEIRANALERILSTIMKGIPRGAELVDRVKKSVMAFDKIGVKQEHLEDYLGHSIDIATAEELADLLAVFNAIEKEGAKREDFFNIGPKMEGGPAADLKERIKGNGDTMTSSAIKQEDLLPFEKEKK